MTIKGSLDTFTTTYLSGWVYDTSDPERKLTVYLKIDGELILSARADLDRADLVKNKVGNGHCAFQIMLKNRLSLNEYHKAEIGILEEKFSFPNRVDAENKFKNELPSNNDEHDKLRTIDEILPGLDPGKKTIAFTSFGPYKEQYGTIWNTLHSSNKYNVINLCTKYTGHIYDYFENTAFIPGNSIRELDFIDYIVTSNQPVKHFPAKSRIINIQHELFDFASSMHYDYQLMSTSLMMRDAKLTLLERLNERTLPGKTINLIPAGYVKVDSMYKSLSENSAESPDTILIVPTYRLQGVKFDGHMIPGYLNDLVECCIREFQDLKIYVRFHPAAIYYYPEAILGFEEKYSGNERITIDRGYGDLLSVYARAILAITDYSGSAYTFAFSTEKPVVFFSPLEDKLIPVLYDAGKAVGYVAKANYLQMRDSVGVVVKNYDQMISGIERLMNKMSKYKKSIAKVRNLVLYNFLGSEEYIANTLGNILDGNEIDGYQINNSK